MPLVLTHKADSGYDDVPEERYHFPSRYRNVIERCAGEWFVYYEPRRGAGRQEYVALARLGQLWPDPKASDHFYVGVSDYSEFPQPVPWRRNRVSIESSLQKRDGSTNKGAFGQAVREVPLAEFNEIVQRGFASALDEDPLPLPTAAEFGMEIVERPIVELVVQRKIRDRAFTATVRNAYSQTCAFTGLKVVNGGGWTEMEAAHIRPVEANGPDSVRNGIALSRTMHALFDRGFLTLTDDFRILEARSAPLPEQLRRLLPVNRLAQVPHSAALRPHRTFLEFHRSRVFKDRAA